MNKKLPSEKPPKLLKAHKKIGPLLASGHFRDTKDPCICFDGKTWHLYGSGGEVEKEEWHILHATAPDILGPWKEQSPAILRGAGGPHVAAPSVIYDPADGIFHMAVQEDFMKTGGGVKYLASADGKTFTLMSTILAPIIDSGEAGLYDPHFSVINNKKYLVYSGMPDRMTYDRTFTPQPDIYLALSETGFWSGPWKRVKKILDHADIAWHHNSREHPDYEWGIEGPQVVSLPDGRVLLNATCFVEEGKRGTRQRVFFAIAENVEGPYRSLGPVLSERDDEWESGENGHASCYVQDDLLYLFYQARPKPREKTSEKNGEKTPEPGWKYGLAIFKAAEIG